MEDEIMILHDLDGGPFILHPILEAMQGVSTPLLEARRGVIIPLLEAIVKCRLPTFGGWRCVTPLLKAMAR